MLYRAMNAAATGMEANIFNLDVIANNLANAGTTAFKTSRVNFEDLYYQYYKIPGAQTGSTLTPIGTAAGLGTRVSGTQQNFTQGPLVQTGRRLDVAISGDGFIPLQDPITNQVVYTRYGQFTLDANGSMVIASANVGRPLTNPITIPPDATQIGISADGIVSVITPSSSNSTQVGQIQLARFQNPEGLLQLGDNLYQQSNASGNAIQGTPGQLGLGTLSQTYIEGSNTEPTTELVNLIKTQRNVELNSQVIQASDQLLQVITNLRRV